VIIEKEGGGGTRKKKGGNSWGLSGREVEPKEKQAAFRKESRGEREDVFWWEGGKRRKKKPRPLL